jgi:hypothetical protein
MATVNQNDLRIKNAKNMLASLNGDTEPSSAEAYVFVGRPTAWPNDNAPPVPTNNFREFYNTYDQMLSLKRITDLDAYPMLPRYKWQSGTTYDIYNPNYSSQSKSFTGQTNLYDCIYVVENTNHSVYVCLDNNGNSASTVEPQDAGDDAFITSDGYQWLRVYDIPALDITDHTTENYMPIIQNNVVDTVDGAVYTVLINSAGTGYTSNPGGFTNQIPYYYARIVGDGSGAVARVSLTLTGISRIEVVRYGSGYTEGTLDFSANNVYGSLVDLDADINGLNPGGNGDFRSTVIITPPGGWGTDLQRELGGTRVGFFSSLGTDSTDYDFTEGISFRQIGVIQNPEFNANVTANAATLCASYAIYYENPTGEVIAIGDQIQMAVDVAGVIKTAKGTVVENDTTNMVLKYIQDPNQHKDLSDGNLYRFAEIKDQSGTAALLITSTTASGAAGTVEPKNYTGAWADMYYIEGFANPDIVRYSGLMTYLTNISPVTRSDNQTEKISLLIGY